MVEPLTPEVLQDPTAVSLARAVTAAKRRAREQGVVPEDNLLTVSQTSETDTYAWRINFGPKSPQFARGGDFMVEVDPDDGSIHRELWGQ
jgi:hypothetical protein